MFLSALKRTALVQRHNFVLKNGRTFIINQYTCYCGTGNIESNKHVLHYKNIRCNEFKIISRTYSRGILDGYIKRVSDNNENNPSENLFTNPRMVLNNYQQKVPEKVFDVYYKKTSTLTKGKKQNTSDWHCSYIFSWPEKIKFESTAHSKKQAAEKAAAAAIQWLYQQKRINIDGVPMLDKDAMNEMKQDLYEPLTASLSDNSVERIERIWLDYQEGIKEIFDKTHEEALTRTTQAPVLISQDSTIDTDDELSGDESSTYSTNNESDSKQLIHPVYGKPITPPRENALRRRGAELKRLFENYDATIQPLPIDEFSERITSTIQSSRVTVIVGAAGCGKSTRVPAAILKSFGAKTAAIVSEPRKVAAIGLAQRVASEMDEEVGMSIGYQVRLRSRPPQPPCGSVLYCTSGVLLKRLQVNPALTGCTHVFIDEAHERDVNTDLTLLLLKRAIELNPELKLIVMSATLDVGVFTRYFDACPVIEVPGRTFPVHITHLDDIMKKYKLKLPNSMDACNRDDGKTSISCPEIVEVIKALDKNEPEGAILVFLPGWAEIKYAKSLLDEQFKQSSTHLILPVHSRLSTEEQTKMFSRPPPGIRKIVLATNIAETSVTIPDVVYVVDSGVHKENRLREATGTCSLQSVWVSEAGAKQRAGRAGRVQPGKCYRMYTKQKEKDFNEHTTPEILRIPLEQVVLDCKTYAPHDKAQNFLLQLPEPPTDAAVKMAVQDLTELGALTYQEVLTPLGSRLAQFSLAPRLGHLLLNSLVLSDAVFAANIAAYLGEDIRIFVNEMHDREEIRHLKTKYSKTSDHMALNMIQDEFEQILSKDGVDAAKTWCDRKALIRDRLYYARALSNIHLEQLLTVTQLSNKDESEQINRFSVVEELNTALLLASCDKLLVTKNQMKRKGKIGVVKKVFTSTGDKAHIGTSSVNSAITRGKSSKPDVLAYFGGYHSVDRRALVVNNSSVVTPHIAVLFCKGDIDVSPVNEDIALMSIPQHRLDVLVPKSQTDAILKAREMLWRTFQFHHEVQPSMLDPDTVTKLFRFRVRLVKALGKILVEEDIENNIDSIDNNTDVE